MLRQRDTSGKQNVLRSTQGHHRRNSSMLKHCSLRLIQRQRWGPMAISFQQLCGWNAAGKRVSITHKHMHVLYVRRVCAFGTVCLLCVYALYTCVCVRVEAGNSQGAMSSDCMPFVEARSARKRLRERDCHAWITLAFSSFENSKIHAEFWYACGESFRDVLSAFG